MSYNEGFFLTHVGPTLAADYARAVPPRHVGDDTGWVVWPARVQADIDTGLDEAASLAKHRAEWCAALGVPVPTPPFPKPPARDQVLNGQTTQQGLVINTAQFGAMPWWGACWAWLTAADRKTAAAQLLAHGDTICLIQLPCGVPLYDEPNQFYSPDKFGPLELTEDGLVALIAEALTLGFTAVWLFLGGDDGQRGYPVAVAQTQRIGPALAVSSFGDLNQWVLQLPGWDGVFYGYSPQQIAEFATLARSAGAIYVGLEHSTGHIPVGNGAADYASGGLMTGFDLVLGEFDEDRFDDTVWQILPRMIGSAYRRPPEQPSGDDPNPPCYLSPASPRGAFVYRVFEYYIYSWVRGASADRVQASRQRFLGMGASNLC